MSDETKSIDALVVDPANRRRHPARNVDMVRDSLQQVGAGRSIVVDEDDVILAGNGVAAAALAAGITSVRVIESTGAELIAVRRRGLTPEQKRALALFDNRTAELAEWDIDGLRGDVDAGLSLQPFWDEDEQAELLTPDIPSPQPQAEPRTSDVMIEIFCSHADLEQFRATLDLWSHRDGVTLNIS